MGIPAWHWFQTHSQGNIRGVHEAVIFKPKWFSQLSDPNPIENLWRELKRRAAKQELNKAGRQLQEKSDLFDCQQALLTKSLFMLSERIKIYFTDTNANQLLKHSKMVYNLFLHCPFFFLNNHWNDWIIKYNISQRNTFYGIELKKW